MFVSVKEKVIIANQWKINYKISIDKRDVEVKIWIVGANVTKKRYEYQWKCWLEWSEDQNRVISKYSGFTKNDKRC